MIYEIMRKYNKFDLRYDIKDKILFIYKPMLVKDFIKLKKDSKKLKLNDIRIFGRCS